jgi:hypothetical protein
VYKELNGSFNIAKLLVTACDRMDKNFILGPVEIPDDFVKQL